MKLEPQGFFLRLVVVILIEMMMVVMNHDGASDDV
jgi:hypothetical protein